MSLEELGTKWAALQGSLRKQAKVMVVDDDEHVRDLLVAVVEMMGYGVSSAPSAEEALPELRDGNFDLLIVDKNLPGASGVDLIGQVKAEKIDTPSVLVTGYASAETISQVLGSGAEDYVAKPFDDVDHLQKRFEAIVEQRRQRIVVQQILADLKSLAESGDVDEERAKEMGRRLAQARRDLDKRPDVLIVDDDPIIAESGARFLKRAGLDVVQPDASTKASEQHAARGAMCVFLSLDRPGSAQTVATLREADPSVAVLVSGRVMGLKEALAAVSAGADDFVLGASEGLDMLVARTRRLVARSRRTRLSLVLIGLLRETLNALGDDVGGMFSAMLEAAPAPVDLPAVPAEVEPDFEIELDIDWEKETTDGHELEPVAAPPAGPMTMERGQGSGALDQAGTPVRDQIEFGIDRFGGDVTVPLEHALRAYRTLGELARFFSDPSRARDKDAVLAFLDGDAGALAALVRAQADLRAGLPVDVQRALDAGVLSHPWQPDYIKKQS
jgi:DNA-binding response OmpR family regulator